MELDAELQWLVMLSTAVGYLHLLNRTPDEAAHLSSVYKTNNIDKWARDHVRSMLTNANFLLRKHGKCSQTTYKQAQQYMTRLQEAGLARWAEKGRAKILWTG